MPCGDVADIGTGSGALAEAYLAAGASTRSMTLLDPSEAMLRDAVDRLQDYPTAFRPVHAEAGGDVLPETAFDRVLMAHVLEHLEDPHAMLGWLYTRLKPGGQRAMKRSRPPRFKRV